MSEIKAIVFDLDNTIYNEEDYFSLVIDEFCTKYNFINSKSKFQEGLSRYRPISKNIILDLFNYANIDYTKYNNLFFELYISVNGLMKTYDDFNMIIHYLRNKGYKIGLITNGLIQAQRNKIKLLGIESAFDHIVYARTWGKEYEKPHHKSFDEIVHKLSLTFPEVAFIGDNPDIDFSYPYEREATTIRVMTGIHNAKLSGSNINYQINNLTELLSIV